MVGDVTRAVLVHIRQAKAKFGCLFPPAILQSWIEATAMNDINIHDASTTYPQKRHNLWAGFGGDHEVETEHP